MMILKIRKNDLASSQSTWKAHRIEAICQNGFVEFKFFNEHQLIPLFRMGFPVSQLSYYTIEDTSQAYTKEAAP